MKLRHNAKVTKRRFHNYLCILFYFYESNSKIQEQRSHVSVNAVWGMTTTSNGLFFKSGYRRKFKTASSAKSDKGERKNGERNKQEADSFLRD